MMKVGRYFYKCDNCGIAKEIEFKTWNDQDTAKVELLKEGWLLGIDMTIEIWCGTKKNGILSGGSMHIKGEYCCDKCFLAQVKFRIRQRRKR